MAKRASDNKNHFFVFQSIKSFLTPTLAIGLIITSRILHSQIYIVFNSNNYLSFQIILELFSIIVSIAIAFYGFASYRYNQSDSQLFLSIIFLIVGILDLMHTLTFKGMPFFDFAVTGERATYFWVIARSTAAIGLLMILMKRIPAKSASVLFASLYLLIIIILVLYWGSVLPPLLNANDSVTKLKVIIEYAICMLHIAAILILLNKHLKNKDNISLNLLAGIFFILISELDFTLYTNVYDIDNLLGHIYKFVGYAYILKSVLKQNVEEPYLQVQLSEKRFNKVFQSAPVLLSIIRKSDHRYVEVNEFFLSNLRLSRDDVLGKTPIDIGVPKAEWQRIFDLFNTNGFVKNLESRVPLGIFLKSAEHIELDGEECILFTNINITELERIQAELRTTAELFHKIFDSSPHMISIVRKLDFRIIDANSRFLSQRGFDREDVIGRTPVELGFPAREFKNLMDLLNEKGPIQNVETLLVNKSGSIGTILFSMETVTLNDEECLIFSSIDITEIKQLQAEVARLDRLNLVGQMAAGIGHEIRNPMTTVRGYLQLLGSKPELLLQKPTFEIMISELDRANSIITEFLSLAKTKPTELKPMNLNDILNNLYPLLEADTFIQNKQIQFIPGDIPEILLNQKEISQLVLNLCRNGLEAMKERGFLRILTYTKSNQLVLSISDEGYGIPPDNLKNLGTPFFTTKSQGTGLGLASCYKIAQSHNAAIDIDTSPEGTTFYVRFAIPEKAEVQSDISAR